MVTINLIVNLLVEKTIAFGGVEIGIIKAQLAAKTIGNEVAKRLLNVTTQSGLVFLIKANLAT